MISATLSAQKLKAPPKNESLDSEFLTLTELMKQPISTLVEIMAAQMPEAWWAVDLKYGAGPSPVVSSDSELDSGDSSGSDTSSENISLKRKPTALQVLSRLKRKLQK